MKAAARVVAARAGAAENQGLAHGAVKPPLPMAAEAVSSVVKLAAVATRRVWAVVGVAVCEQAGPQAGLSVHLLQM
jgi:hypothetical protein